MNNFEISFWDAILRRDYIGAHTLIEVIILRFFMVLINNVFLMFTFYYTSFLQMGLINIMTYSNGRISAIFTRGITKMH